MKAAILAKRFSSGLIETLKQVAAELYLNKIELVVNKPLFDFLLQHKINITGINDYYEKASDISTEISVFFSLGGDGTFLEVASFVQNKNIPIIGINAGRLGFLANISQQEIKQSVEAIVTGNYELESRALIKLDYPENQFNNFPYALNDLTIQKKDTSLITIHAYINNEYLNGYWTDGLIISTPTGSTAYSMSVGGPIVCPECKTFIISPIASHNLSVRPLIIDYNNSLSFQIESRNCKYLLTLDSTTIELDTGTQIRLKKADFEIKTIKLKPHSFYNTIRQKLMWGIDPRN